MNTNDIKKMMEAYLEVVSEKKAVKKEQDKLDPVDDKENDKKFKDRKDKDIDNDGDVDGSDEYLHKRRAATDDAIDARDGEEPADDGKKQAANKKGKTAEISKIGEKSVKKEDVDVDTFLADLNEEQLEELSRELIRRARDKADAAGDKAVSRLDKAYDRNVDKAKADGADHHSAHKQGMKSKGAQDAQRELDKRERQRKKFTDKADEQDKDVAHYRRYRKSGGKLSMDAFMSKIRNGFHVNFRNSRGGRGYAGEPGSQGGEHWYKESVDFESSTNQFLDALEEAQKASAKPKGDEAEKIDDKDSPKAKEMRKDHDKSEAEHEKHQEKAVDATVKAGQAGKEAPKRPGDNKAGDKNVVNPVKEDNRTFQQKIMDVLSGKSMGEITQEDVDMLNQEDKQ